MGLYTSNRDGGKTDENGLYNSLSAIIDGDVIQGLTAAQRGAGANMSVDIAIGNAMIHRAAGDYAHSVWNDATYNQVISTADVSNPRKDIIVMYVDYATTPSTGVTNNSNGVVKIKVVDGTAAAVPDDPSSATIQSSVGSGNPYIKLCRVRVGASVTTITTSVIDDLRVFTSFSLDSGGWTNGVMPPPDTVTANGNGNYDLVFNSTDLTGYISQGMRLRSTRTVAAPTQCTSLNGTTQYWVKTSPNKLTFTDDFAIGVWVKATSYQQGGIVSRFNGTSGWILQMAAVDGRVSLVGFNGGAGNSRRIVSHQSLPLNEWVFIAAQLDMSVHTATSTTSYIMFNGVDIPAEVVQAGTNPTALIQAGNLEIGSFNVGSFFAGKIAQVAIFNAKVTQATMRSYMSQGIVGNETSLASAYSFSNSVTDLNTTTPNDLSAGAGSPVATNADSPFGAQASGLVSSALDYAIIGTSSFSTNTTLNVQAPEGCTIPTSGGVSAMAYSTQKAPYGFPSQKEKWRVSAVSYNYPMVVSIGSINTWHAYYFGINVPIGSWMLGMKGAVGFQSTVAGIRSGFFGLLNSPTNTNYSSDLTGRVYSAASVTTALNTVSIQAPLTLAAATTYTPYGAIDSATGTETWNLYGSQALTVLYADNALL